MYQVNQGAAKANLSILITFSASGSVTPPMIIYHYKKIPSGIIRSVPVKWSIGTSDNDLMKAEVFYECIDKEHIHLSVILFVVGHKTHMTYELSFYAPNSKLFSLRCIRMQQGFNSLPMCPASNLNMHGNQQFSIGEGQIHLCS